MKEIKEGQGYLDMLHQIAQIAMDNKDYAVAQAVLSALEGVQYALSE